MESTKPIIRVYDLETSLNIVSAFSLFNKMPLPHSSIMQERTLICGSWKDLGKKKIYSVCVNAKDVTDDKAVVKAVHKMLSESDAAVAHFGDAFDMKMFNTRAIKHGLDPIHNVIQIDTYKMAKAKFRFNSNRLDYLGEYLEVGKKIKTDHELWIRCLLGEAKALKEMVTYNRQDVNLLEKVYLKLRAWHKIPQVNQTLWGDGTRDVCESCGSKHINYRGYERTKQRKYRAYQCQDCGHWGRSRHSEKIGE